MKGMIEEYGTYIIAVIIAFIVLTFLLNSVISPEGSIHKFAIVNMESMGAETQTVLEGCSWTIDGIEIVLKDDGGLYLSGTGTLPNYETVEDTPWAAKAGKIDFVSVESGVIVSGKIPTR